MSTSQQSKPTLSLRWLALGGLVLVLGAGFALGLGDLLGLDGSGGAGGIAEEYRLARSDDHSSSGQSSNSRGNAKQAAAGHGSNQAASGKQSKRRGISAGGDPLLAASSDNANGDASDRSGAAGSASKSTEASTLDAALTGDFDPAQVGRRKVSREGLGDLVVLVVSSENQSPVSGAEVIAPLDAQGVTLSYGQLKLPTAAAGATKKTDGAGEVRFAVQELKLTGTEVVSVVVRQLGKVPVVKQLRKADLRGKHATIKVELANALRITGTVSGKNGERIGSARVLIRAGELQQQPLDDSFVVTADANGSFDFDVSANFAYQLEVSAEGFVTNLSRRFDFRRDERAITIILQEGRGVEGFVFAGSSPGVGAQVVVIGRSIQAVADERGHFVLAGLEDRVTSNEFTVRVVLAGFAPVVRSVVVNDRALEIQLAPEASISGRVVEDAVGVAGATLYGALRQNNRDFPLLESTSGADGVFRVGTLGRGRVTLRARTADGKFSLPLVLDLNDGEAKENVELTLGAGGELRLQVASSPPSGPITLTGLVALIDGSPLYDDDGDGFFTASGLSDGQHSITLASLPSVELPASLVGQNVFAARAVGNAQVRYFTLPGAAGVELKLGEVTERTVNVVEVNAAEERTIKVKLMLDRPSTLTDVELTLNGNSPGAVVPTITRLVTLNSGQATVEDVVLVADATYGLRVKHQRVKELTLDNSRIEGLKDGDTLEVSLEETLALRGYIKDSSGNALSDTAVRLALGGRQTGTANSDQLGYFEIGGLEAGTHQLTAFKQSYYQYVATYEVSWSNTEAVEITILGANEIRVTVVNASGSPVVGANVRTSRPSTDDPASPIEYFNLGGTDGDGRKIVNFHWIRHYQVYAYSGNQMGFINFDNLAEESVREFTLTLEPSTTITGSVVSLSSGQPVTDTDVFADYLDSNSERGSNNFYVRANANGQFSITVPVGSFDVVGRASRAYLEGRVTSVGGGQSNIVVQVPPREEIEGNWAEFVSVSVPSSVTAGSTFTALVTVRNRGSTTWSEATQHRIGSQSPQDNSRWGVGRAMLPPGTSVPTNALYTFSLTLTAPTTAGNHPMQWRMVHEGREWFGERSNRISVTVSAASG